MRTWIQMGKSEQFVEKPIHVRDKAQTPGSLSGGTGHYAAIVASSDDAIIGKSLDGIIESWNEGAQRLFGYTAREAIGQPATLLIPDERHDEEPHILGRIRRGERIDHYETVRRRKDGSLVDISLTVSPVFDAAGRIVGAAKIARDIGERKRAEAVTRLLNLELQHRTRNLLAVIHSIARSSLKSGQPIEEGRAAFLTRLHALSHANELLATADWQAVMLHDVIARAMQPFGARHTIEGENVMLDASATQGFSLVVHELCTNAYKYGALSVREGTVAIRWSVDSGTDGDHLRFCWQESGGPAVTMPTRTSFGTELLKSAVAGSETGVDYDVGGLVYTLRVPYQKATAQVSVEGSL
jgi:PAS domain S-box-containing protein